MRYARTTCALHARATCPHYMPASRSSMGAWCVSSVFVCQAVMWRHAMPLEPGVSREHGIHNEHMISQVRGYQTYSYYLLCTSASPPSSSSSSTPAEGL